MNVFRRRSHLRRWYLALLSMTVLLLMGLVACSPSVQAQPAPQPTPTWGSFFPTVVPFPTPTVVGKGERSIFWQG